MSGGAIQIAPEDFLENLPIYTNENPRQGYGIFEGTINGLVNPVYKVDGNGVGIVYLEPGVHYSYNDSKRDIEAVESPGDNWVVQLRAQTGLQLEQVSSGFQVEDLTWRQVRFKMVTAG